MKLKMLMLLQVLTVSVAHAEITEAWKNYSRPSIMEANFTHSFNALPLAGSVELGPKAWSSDYWPTFKGGINVRWNAKGTPGFNLESPTKDMAKAMGTAELAQLSPSEKFDLLNGNYDFPLKAEVAAKVFPDAPDWSGICHGWAPAAIHHNEPTPKVLANPDGVLIPFGSSDIKALLSYYYATRHEATTNRQVGRRCNNGRLLSGTRTCSEDLNAGAFHIIIGNMLGIKKQGFVADIDRLKEVWNQPATGYSSVVLQDNIAPSRKAAAGTVKEMKIETKFYYVDESDVNTMEIAYGTPNQIISFLNLVYNIEINAKGEIIGGTWVSKIRPDFLWNKPKIDQFKGLFVRLPELLND